MPQKNILLNPIAEVDLHDAGLAPRPSDLNDKVVGLLDNGQPFAGAFLARVAEHIQRRYPQARFLTWRKHLASVVGGHAGRSGCPTGACKPVTVEIKGQSRSTRPEMVDFARRKAYISPVAFVAWL